LSNYIRRELIKIVSSEKEFGISVFSEYSKDLMGVALDFIFNYQ